MESHCALRRDLIRKPRGSATVHATAVILEGPKKIGLGQVSLVAPSPEDMVVRVCHSGISTGTEKLFWSGRMPPFPGMGYPLIPGYEAAGEVVSTPKNCEFSVGDHVFVPGANCYGDVRGLFGGASSMLVTAPERAVRIDRASGPEGALLALAATAAAVGPSGATHRRVRASPRVLGAVARLSLRSSVLVVFRHVEGHHGT